MDAQGFINGYALIIGVGKDLPTTVSDAEVVSSILTDTSRCAYPVEQVQLLTEEKASRINIIKAFNTLKEQVDQNPDATVVVYFSGHGIENPQYYLLSNDYDLNNLTNTSISGQEFTQMLATLNAKKLLVVLDACHAGGFVADISAFPKSPLPPQLIETLSTGSGRVIFASSRKDQESLILQNAIYSVFTEALVEALSGAGNTESDGFSRVADIAMYVSRVVADRTEDEQHPILKFSQADNFAVAYYSGGVKTINPLPGSIINNVIALNALSTDNAARYRTILQKYQTHLLDIEEQMANFYDEAAIPLDIQRTKTALIGRIEEVEQNLRHQTQLTSKIQTTFDSNQSIPRQNIIDELKYLFIPTGAVKLDDPFYLERDGDMHLKRQMAHSGTITIIRGSRQTGKSSLLVRGVNHAQENGEVYVDLDLQRVDQTSWHTKNRFLFYLAGRIARKLRLDHGIVDKAWNSQLGPQDKITYFMEDHVLSNVDEKIILALDEIDLLIQTDYYAEFFGLLRSWHNSAAFDSQWKKLNIILAISTEPYLLIDNPNQSPFNVGLKIFLEDFSEAQVEELNQRHGFPIHDDDFEDFMEFLGGHPYLTRQALYTLVVNPSSNWLDLKALALFDNSPFSGHLKWQYSRVEQGIDLRKLLQQVLDNEIYTNNTACSYLVSAGIIKRRGKKYGLRCGLYQKYFREKLG